MGFMTKTKSMNLSYICLLVFLLSCGKETSLSLTTANNVYGKNDREKLLQMEKPFSWIGMLELPKGGNCTASLVGEDLVLTAAHCILDKQEKLLYGKYSFKLGYDNGHYIAESGVESFTYGIHPLTNRADDWAILKLSRPLGKSGYFGSKSIKHRWSNDNFDLTLAGYSTVNPSTNELYFHNGCSVKKHILDGKIFYHDCDSGPGDSGAPIFKCVNDDCYIVAIHVAAKQGGSPNALYLPEYDSDKYQNIACSNENFGSKLKKIRLDNN